MLNAGIAEVLKPVNMAGDGKREMPVTPDAVVVRAHLRHVLGHAEFAAAPQLSAFLSYIVERKLEGAEDRIKAYTIATEALGRPASFDPQTDPIVRVQARRLRQALLAYYALPHADDTLRITLPVGGYVPELKAFAQLVRHGDTKPGGKGAIPASRLGFAALAIAVLALGLAIWSNIGVIRATWEGLTWNQPATEENPLGMPAIVVSVASERQLPGWFSGELFAKGVESNLAKFDEFAVLAPLGNRPLADSDYRLDLVFAGTPGAVLGTARLMRGRSGEIVWSNRFTIPEDSIDSYELIDPVRRLSSTLGQPYGVLYSQILSDPEHNADQVCLLSGYEWFQNPAKEAIEPIRTCLSDILLRKPGNHVAYMMLAYVYVARYRWGMGNEPAAELAQALNMAKRAIALRPESAGTYQAMMEVQWAREKFALAEEAGRSAVARNPNSSDVIADFGCRLIYKGKYSEGETYASRAARWNSQPPVWHQFCLFLAAYNSGNLDDARQVAERLEGQQGPEAYVPVILMAMADDRRDKAQAAFEKLVA